LNEFIFFSISPDNPAILVQDPSAFRHPVTRGFGFF
jgi:hypothetical protein